MKIFFLSIITFFCVSSAKAGNAVIVPYQSEKISFASKADILQDFSQNLIIDSLIRFEYPFEPLPGENFNTGFTTSTYWIRFTLKYSGLYPETFFLETARPITNIVELYHPDEFGNYKVKYSGDEKAFDKKDVAHRLSLFELPLMPGNQYTYYLKLTSDGEVINIPLKLYSIEGLRKKDYHEQFFQGIYYGLILLVILIFLFFYFALKEQSFLYYVLFVTVIGLLQLSLDGFTFQYLLNDQPWVANRAVLISASLALVFVSLHAQSYLKTKEFFPKINKVFSFFVLSGLAIFFSSFTEGSFYAISFPTINVISLVATIFTITVIFIYIFSGKKVNLFYLTAFLCMVSGAIFFILGNTNTIENSYFSENALKFGSGLQIIFLSFAMAGRYKSLQMEKEKAQAATLEKLEEMNRLKDSINIELEKQVKERTTEIRKQKEEIEHKNKDITDSINYAKKIQEAILPDNDILKSFFADSFVLFKPKDIVSGDFYWSTHIASQNRILIAAADCTGHGVPGAFMSMIGNSLLNEIVIEKEIYSPSLILEALRNGIIKSLKQTGVAGENKDGMDIALLAVTKLSDKSYEIEFSGANNPLWLISSSLTLQSGNGEVNFTNPNVEDEKVLLHEIKADKQPIGYYNDILKPFTNHKFTLSASSSLFIFSDGYADQFGGEQGKKFKSANFKKLLLSINDKTMEEQKEIIIENFNSWKGQLEQVDDVCVIGLRL